jgi:cytochrome c oxidase subunit 3
VSSVTATHEGGFSRLNMNRAGLWLFFVSEGFMFAGLLATRFALMPGTRPELNQTIGLIVTSILLLSSFFMYRAETAIAHGDRSTFVISTFLTMVLGVVFLVGVVGFEWLPSEFGPSDGASGSVFFALTGMHAFHVLTGVIFLFVVFTNGLRGNYSAESHWGVEACALYWHFVDVVWVFFYVSLYLVGRVA